MAPHSEASHRSLPCRPRHSRAQLSSAHPRFLDARCILAANVPGCIARIARPALQSFTPGWEATSAAHASAIRPTRASSSAPKGGSTIRRANFVFCSKARRSFHARFQNARAICIGALMIGSDKKG